MDDVFDFIVLIIIILVVFKIFFADVNKILKNFSLYFKGFLKNLIEYLFRGRFINLRGFGKYGLGACQKYSA